MSELSEKETETAGLPLLLEQSGSRPSLARSAPNVEFVSQLIAARDRLAPQRARRTDSPEGAVGAYDQGGRIAERRMPAGFRKTVVV